MEAQRLEDLNKSVGHFGSERGREFILRDFYADQFAVEPHAELAEA